MEWRPVDIVVIILASAIGVSTIITVVAPMILGQAITDERSKILATITTAIVAIISVYVGSELNLTNP